jgi:hypothetical protein
MCLASLSLDWRLCTSGAGFRASAARLYLMWRTLVRPGRPATGLYSAGARRSTAGVSLWRLSPAWVTGGRCVSAG